MDRAQKQEVVADLHQAFQGAQSVVVSHYTGLTAGEATALRNTMRDAGARFRVTKNRLTKLALKDTPYEGLTDLFTGPTAIAWSDDPVAAAKATNQFAKSSDHLIILGGGLGPDRLDADAIKALADMPSLDELRGTIVGLLQAPATKIAGVLQAPAGQLARVFGAYGQSGGQSDDRSEGEAAA